MTFADDLLGTTAPDTGTPEKADRNAEMRTAFAAGVPIGQLAGRYGITPARVGQIVSRGDRSTVCRGCGCRFTPRNARGRRPRYCDTCRGIEPESWENLL